MLRRPEVRDLLRVAGARRAAARATSPGRSGRDGRAPRGDRGDQAPLAVEGRSGARSRPGGDRGGLRRRAVPRASRCSPTARTSAARSTTSHARACRLRAAGAAQGLRASTRSRCSRRARSAPTRSCSIVAAIPDDVVLADLHELAVGLGLAVLVETHDDAELERALSDRRADRRRERARPRARSTRTSGSGSGSSRSCRPT